MAKWTLRKPTAIDDFATAALDTAVVIHPLANDSDSNGDRLTLVAIDGYSTRYRDWVRLENGWVHENNKGTLTYFPDDGFVGTETFTYTISDRGFWYRGKKSTATITIEVAGNGNQAPVAAIDAVSVNEDSQVLIDVLANDSDADGDTLTITNIGPSTYGAVTQNSDGTLTYTPNNGFSGIDSFDYTISDGFGGLDTATVTVTVDGVNDAPSAADDTASTSKDTAVVINVLANDTDTDGDILSVSNTGLPAHGSVQNNHDGTLTYTPNSGHTGADSFSYTIFDGNGEYDSAIVTVNVSAGTHTNPHAPGTPEHAEHAAVFELVKHTDATHVAVSSGDWFDSSIWAGGLIPDDDARVLISDGVQVSYGGISDARLHTVRVDGELHFSTTTDSQMIVDTMVVDGSGTLTAGTKAAPVEAGINVDIIIANNGDIDVSWDPNLLSRGVISHGTVEMHGQEKTVHLKVAVDPKAGDTSITLSETPENWAVGDKVVLTGTEYDGYIWANNPSSFKPPQDEVLTITAINGDTIHFSTALQYDHVTPRADLKASVANYTRNVSIETENADSAAVYQRGHVMFMHNDDVNVSYTEFHELGRTDKSLPARNVHEFIDLTADSNVKGRYSFHLHKTGVDDVANPAVAEGNAVFGSPGWGYVQHQSNAILHNNASYNTFGAGFVAESGNETGSWSNNIAIFAKGINWAVVKNQNDGSNFDTGRGGDGFFFQGRMIEAFDNIAASVNHGYTYYHRGRLEDPQNGLDGQVSFNSALFELPEALGSQNVLPTKTPIRNFVNNEVFAANEGLHVIKENPYQGHDVHSHIKAFTAWEVNRGASLNYSGHYILEDIDLVAKVDPGRQDTIENGLKFGQNSVDITVVRPTIDGFQYGVNFDKSFSFREDISVTQYNVVAPTFSNIQNKNLLHFSSEIDDVLSAAELISGRFNIDLDQPLFFTAAHPTVTISGTKTDSIGPISLPAGSDGYAHTGNLKGYNAFKHEVIRILKEDGYYTSGEDHYFILEDYYSDRGNGDIKKYGHVVEIDPSVVRQFSIPGSEYEQARYSGEINLANTAPVARADSATTSLETDVIIDVLANDWDLDGDLLEVDGILQPVYGAVFDNGDGTVTYRPYLDFTGTETFKYWATDNQGAFTEGWVTVEVWDV